MELRETIHPNWRSCNCADCEAFRINEFERMQNLIDGGDDAYERGYADGWEAAMQKLSGSVPLSRD